MTDKHALCILGRLNKLSEVAARKYSKDEEILNLSQALQIGIDAIKQKRPHGEWKLKGMIWYCSKCGKDCEQSGNNFCGQCGADMREETENDIQR